MQDTIELLEAIGQNATLRHASAEELAPVLEQANASDAFRTAVISGDSSSLSSELGQKPLYVTHHSQAPGHEEDQPDHDEPDAPSGPGQGEPLINR